MKRGKTVRELIEELQKLDQDACVWVEEEGYYPPEIDVFCEGGADSYDKSLNKVWKGDYYFYAG